MTRILSAIALLSAAVGIGVVAADAHPRLQETMPAKDARLSASPKQIRLGFSEGLVAVFSGVELKDGKGRPVSIGKAALVSGDNRKMVAPIPARLVPGTYHVNWHAVSVDTHRVNGSYSFKVVK